MKNAKQTRRAETKTRRGCPTRAAVIGPYLSAGGRAEALSRSPEARLDEAVGLAKAIDLDVPRTFQVNLSTITPATYLGKGKVEEVAREIEDEEIGLVIMRSSGTSRAMSRNSPEFLKVTTPEKDT